MLDLYAEAFDPQRPLVCVDELPYQLLAEVSEPLPLKPGSPKRVDYEYARRGTCSVFCAFEPLAGRRVLAVHERRTALDFAHFMRDVAKSHPQAAKIRVVLDNLNTHSPSAFYQAFPAAEARALTERFEFHYTPVHGSWLNQAET